MLTTILTMWYNEAFLAPFFLSHYAFADRIHILLDKDTDDATQEVCSQFKNVEIEPFTFPDMMDDELKAAKISSAARDTKSDWIIAVDADEFIFPAGVESVENVLSRQSANLLYVQMWQVYRHKTDSDLDPNLPAIFQRRHGDPNVTVGGNALYSKPIVVRSGLDLEWEVGCHAFLANEKVVVSDDIFLGAHWAMVDSDMAIERRIKGRRERQSRNNLEKGYTCQHHTITEEQIRSQCFVHENDPLLF